jgi:hypothetical protein
LDCNDHQVEEGGDSKVTHIMSVARWETGVEQTRVGQLDTSVPLVIGGPHPCIVVEVIRVMKKRDEW